MSRRSDLWFAYGAVIAGLILVIIWLWAKIADLLYLMPFIVIGYLLLAAAFLAYVHFRRMR